ncbi:MAG: glycosyltransferase family 2 protein [Spartobacteria bacterium]|nr:glycosyltransferase family 2 protein [Spartobacteria bacterium]
MEEPASAERSARVRIIRCHCPKCALAVHVHATPAPVVCPYCRRPLDRDETDVAVAPAADFPSLEEARVRLGRLYRRPPKWLAGLILTVAVLMLATAVFMQLRSAGNYFYQPLVSLYSLVAGLFVVSRFLIASMYVAPPDLGFEPTATVLVPCMNEGAVIRQTIERIFGARYPDDKIEVVCVNDGSTDDTLAQMLAAQTRHPNLVVVDFEKNRGLSHAWAVAVLLGRGEFVVCVDSDTFIFPGSIQKLLQGFADPSVGGVSGHCDVENAGANLLTRMQDVRYFFSYKVMKAAESVSGTVSCLPGCFSAYRRVCVLHVLDEWLNAKVMGDYGNFGDDRSLTNLILKDYKILYHDQALATTIAPEKWGVYVRQQARWSRSYLREILKVGRWMWRKHPVPALSWYAMMWMPIIEPVVITSALVVAPVLAILSGGSNLAWSYLLGVTAITVVWTLHYWEQTGRRHWWTGFLYTVTYMGFFSWQIYWALATIRGRHWGTRG